MRELILIENMLINLIILKTTSLIIKERGKFYLLSAFLSGCFAMILPILNLNNFGQVLYNLGLTIILICISFKFKTLKKFVKIYSVYYLSSFIYGGACYFFTQLFTTRSLLLVLAIIISVYLIVKLLIKIFHKKNTIDKFCYEIEIELSGRKSKWKAFLDSGNFLTDPVTESPVSLINFKVFSSLYDVSMEDLILGKVKGVKFAHYINLDTLGGRDRILTFQVDSLKIGDKVLKAATLGLCLKNFNDAFGSDVLLNSSLV